MTDGSSAAGDGRSDDGDEEGTPTPLAVIASDPMTDADVTRAERRTYEAEERRSSTVETTDGDEDEVDEEDDEEEDDDDEEDEEDEEPRLKYARLTPHLGPVYRNGDATSSFLTAGDKMIIGTHNGNIHVIQLPLFQSLRVYHAHSASVTAVSISPYPPPLPVLKNDQVSKVASHGTNSPHRPGSIAESHVSAAAASRKPKEANLVLNTPSNNIHIATSSMDGNVCVQSLTDVKDVTLRNFARPVQAVALSPDYKNDRTYLSGGLAGQFILTVNAPTGRSTSTTVGTAAAAAGWLGSVGLGNNTGKDTVLHSGEGTINAIKWSLSGKFVACVNEYGVWIWRTDKQLEKHEVEDGWKRIGHVDRPDTEEWDQMATVWKGRLEWIDEATVDPDEDNGKGATTASKKGKSLGKRSGKSERLIIGWGGIVWVVNVHPGGLGVGRHIGEKSAASAEVVQKFRMDCIVSGISLYTRNLVLVLAYCLPGDDDEDEEHEDIKAPRGHSKKDSITSTGSEPSGGIKRRQNNLPPELRLIDLETETEVPMESLSVSRFERLSASDYHLGVLPAQNAASAVASSKGALEALASLSTDMWNAALNPIVNPKSLFSSGASVKSKSSDGAGSSTRVPSSTNSTLAKAQNGQSVHPNLLKPGLKIFIHSPYDCILATKRDLADHLGWLLEREQYKEAWELVDEHPEIMTFAERHAEALDLPDRQESDDFYDDSASVLNGNRNFYSSAEKEKRRIGELWIQQLVQAGNWTKAGEIAGRVVGTADKWEKWVWAFAGADKFDEIAAYMPTEPMRPPIRPVVYEAVLGHYIQTDKPRFRDLLDRWSLELFDLNAVTSALEDQLKYREIREDSVEDGEVGRDWRLVMESLAKLHEANGRNREALKCFIKLQDADNAMRLIKEGHLAEAVADDIPAFIALRVPTDQLDSMSNDELEQATEEPITLLVDEAQHGLVQPNIVVTQLQEKKLDRYTFYYLRGLWKGEGIKQHQGEWRERLVSDSQSLVDEFADLAVRLFAEFDHVLLMQFLKTSTAYHFEKAVQVCETHTYIPELVYLYSKTGQNQRALYLIIDRLRDVSQAISFAKEQDDPDLWEDLLNYSMDKPRFIRGLLEEVGTAVNPIQLVRRIPEGLEIPGLREGLKHIMKEHEIQYSISAGVAKVLRSEVSAAQGLLRSGQRKGVKFEVAVHADGGHVDVAAKGLVPAATQQPQDIVVGIKNGIAENEKVDSRRPKPGHCAQCHEPFTEWEMETLVGFQCGHVYHLTHLMEVIEPGKEVDLDFLAPSEDGFVGGGAGSTHFVGPKVTRARLLRDRIRGGCPVCNGEEGAV